MDLPYKFHKEPYLLVLNIQGGDWFTNINANVIVNKRRWYCKQSIRNLILFGLRNAMERQTTNVWNWRIAEFCTIKIIRLNMILRKHFVFTTSLSYPYISGHWLDAVENLKNHIPHWLVVPNEWQRYCWHKMN